MALTCSFKSILTKNEMKEKTQQTHVNPDLFNPVAFDFIKLFQSYKTIKLFQISERQDAKPYVQTIEVSKHFMISASKENVISQYFGLYSYINCIKQQ